MGKDYDIPTARAETEIIIKGSRFLSYADFTPSVERAKGFIAEIKAMHPQASHHVYAFAVGYGATITHGMTDDGEPSNTAGKPTLAVVKGSDIGDVTVVTVRYFGGTKLGTGGLVKAYTEAAQAVFSVLPTERKIEKGQILFEVPYHLYEQTTLLCAEHQGEIDETDFGVGVVLTVTFPVDCIEPFAQDMSELSAGQVQILYL